MACTGKGLGEVSAAGIPEHVGQKQKPLPFPETRQRSKEKSKSSLADPSIKSLKTRKRILSREESLRTDVSQSLNYI